MRYTTYGAALGAAIAVLAGCAPTVPDSAAGVGFGDYDSYAQQQAAREAQLSGQKQAGASGLVQPQDDTTTGAPLSATGQAMAPLPSYEQEADGQEQVDPVDQLAADTAAVLNSGQEPLQADPNNPPPEAVNEMGISRENDFDDVSGLRSIESDAERIERNRDQYEVVQPEALPEREGKDGPNIVAYALRTTNPAGTPLYNRMTLFDTEARMTRNCAKYPSADQAQIAFLERGGPERDRLGLDPDGDGFACDWDPGPFRSARDAE